MVHNRPTRRLPTLIAALLAVSTLLSGCVDDGDGAGGGGDGDTENPDYGEQETWYLHETGPCDNSGDQEYFLNTNDTDDPGHGCGTFGSSPSGWTFTYPSEGSSHGHTTETPVDVAVYIQTPNPGPVTVEWTLSAAGSEVASGSIEGTSVGPAGYVEYAQETTTTAEVPADASLTFSFHVPTAAGVVRGYDGDSTSRVILG